MDDSTPLCALLDEGYDIPEATWPLHAKRRIAFHANNMLAICEGVRAGLGTALLPHYVAREDEGLRLLHEVPEVMREIWLAYPTEFRGASRFRPVIEWLADTLSQC
jgi:DNA-binding transcriptional LysR family regulator